MSTPLLFEKITSIKEITLKIKTIEFMRIGAEKSSSRITGSDLPILLDPKGIPFIPGSTIKGMFRSEFSRLLYGKGEQYLKQTFHTDKVEEDEKNISRFLSKVNSSINESQDRVNKIVECIYNSLSGKDCSVDQGGQEIKIKLGIIDLLFGSSLMMSPLIFTDAVTKYNTDIATRYHIKIDRDTNKVSKGALVNLEAINPDTEFEGKIIYRRGDFGNDSVIDLAFVKLIEFFNGKELLIGGWKSRGYGLINLTLSSPVEIKV
jgi:CRISPR/Cas system CSM-associated protein Csm3 (group 7 of RAMP superfamily)